MRSLALPARLSTVAGCRAGLWVLRLGAGWHTGRSRGLACSGSAGLSQEGLGPMGICGTPWARTSVRVVAAMLPSSSGASQLSRMFARRTCIRGSIEGRNEIRMPGTPQCRYAALRQHVYSAACVPLDCLPGSDVPDILAVYGISMLASKRPWSNACILDTSTDNEATRLLLACCCTLRGRADCVHVLLTAVLPRKLRRPCWCACGPPLVQLWPF